MLEINIGIILGLVFTIFFILPQYIIYKRNNVRAEDNFEKYRNEKGEVIFPNCVKLSKSKEKDTFGCDEYSWR